VESLSPAAFERSMACALCTGLSVTPAPRVGVRVEHLEFDPNRVCGCDNSTGGPSKMAGPSEKMTRAAMSVWLSSERALCTGLSVTPAPRVGVRD